MEGRGGVREGREKKGRKQEKSESGIVPLRNTDYAQNLLTTSPYTPEALPTPNHLQCTIFLPPNPSVPDSLHAGVDVES